MSNILLQLKDLEKFPEYGLKAKSILEQKLHLQQLSTSQIHTALEQRKNTREWITYSLALYTCAKAAELQG